MNEPMTYYKEAKQRIYVDFRDDIRVIENIIYSINTLLYDMLIEVLDSIIGMVNNIIDYLFEDKTEEDYNRFENINTNIMERVFEIIDRCNRHIRRFFLSTIQGKEVTEIELMEMTGGNNIEDTNEND